MDLIRSYYYSSTKQELLIAVIALEAFFTFPFIICSFVVAGTANAGFNCVLTGLLNVALAAGSYHVVKNSKAPIAVGFLLGSSGMMTLLNLMTAIYWGQLSGCKFVKQQLAGYTCTNHSAYGAVCAFAVFLFLTQLGFTTALALWRSEFIVEPGVYDDVPQNSSHSGPVGGFTYAAPPMHMSNPSNQVYVPVHPTTVSADL